jgi:hypothetical protein
MNPADASSIIDVQTLARIGMSSVAKQQLAASIINTWTTILAADRIEAFRDLSHALKRKADQIDHLLHENQQLLLRVPSTDLNEIEALKTKLTEKDKEIETLKTKRPRNSKEADVPEAKTKEHASLTKELAKLKTENDKLKKESENKTAEFQGRYSTVHAQAKRQLDDLDLRRQLAVQTAREAINVIQDSSTLYAEMGSVINGLHSDIAKQYQLQERLTRCMSSFYDAATKSYMICPVPTRTGRIIPLQLIINEWKIRAGDFQGKEHATFRCAISGCDDEIGSAEQIAMIRKFARDMGLNMKAPIRISISQDTQGFVDLPFFDQLRIISTMCKMFRTRDTEDSEERVFLLKGHRCFIIKLSKITSSDNTPSYKMVCQFVACFSQTNPPPEFKVKITADSSTFQGVEYVCE